MPLANGKMTPTLSDVNLNGTGLASGTYLLSAKVTNNGARSDSVFITYRVLDNPPIEVEGLISGTAVCLFSENNITVNDPNNLGPYSFQIDKFILDNGNKVRDASFQTITIADANSFVLDPKGIDVSGTGENLEILPLPGI